MTPRLRHLAHSVVLLLSCNALLDNDPRHLEPESGGGGASGGTDVVSQGGSEAEGGSPPEGGTGAAGVPSASGGSGPEAGAAGGEACGGLCSLPQAVSACRDGACVISSCQAGFIDENVSAADGCEAGDVAKVGLSLWLMGDRGVTLGENGVGTWTDQSANRVEATQDASGLRPKRVQPAAGPPLIEFDGVDDALALPEGFATFNGTSFFAVVNAFAADTCAGILSFSNGPDVNDIEFGRHQRGLLYYEVVGQFVEGVTDAFEPNRRLLVSIVQATSGATQLRINGVLNASKTINVPSSVVRRQNFVGKDVYSACPQSYKGQLGELILYTRPVSDAERVKIQNYLAAKWNVPVQ